MISARDKILLDVAYDLISEVHTNICNSTEMNNKEELAKEAFDILKRVYLLCENLN
jgi:hypothetical protein